MRRTCALVDTRTRDQGTGHGERLIHGWTRAERAVRSGIDPAVMSSVSLSAIWLAFLLAVASALPLAVHEVSTR